MCMCRQMEGTVQCAVSLLHDVGLSKTEGHTSADRSAQQQGAKRSVSTSCTMLRCGRSQLSLLQRCSVSLSIELT